MGPVSRSTFATKVGGYEAQAVPNLRKIELWLALGTEEQNGDPKSRG